MRNGIEDKKSGGYFIVLPLVSVILFGAPAIKGLIDKIFDECPGLF
jgi:hypothetical protein